MANEEKSYPAYPATLRNVNEAMQFAASRETFEIHKAVLYAPGEDDKDVYLIALRGTDRSFDKTDVLGIHSCLMAFLSKPGIYFQTVKEEMLKVIPAGAYVVMIGHSLGGMIAQQIVADKELGDRCRFLNALNIGSPYVPVKSRACPLHRMAERADIVPWLGFSVRANLFKAKPVFKNDGYFGQIEKAHTDAYRNSASWNPYDVFGVLNGGRVLVMTDLEQKEQ